MATSAFKIEARVTLLPGDLLGGGTGITDNFVYTRGYTEHSYTRLARDLSTSFSVTSGGSTGAGQRLTSIGTMNNYELLSSSGTDIHGNSGMYFVDTSNNIRFIQDTENTSSVCGTLPVSNPNTSGGSVATLLMAISGKYMYLYNRASRTIVKYTGFQKGDTSSIQKVGETISLSAIPETPGALLGSFAVDRSGFIYLPVGGSSNGRRIWHYDPTGKFIAAYIVPGVETGSVDSVSLSPKGDKMVISGVLTPDHITVLSVRTNNAIAPENPTTVVAPTQAKVGDNLRVSWTPMPLPAQLEGVVLDTNDVYYDLFLFDGATWSMLIEKTRATQVDATVPVVPDTDIGRVRVASYVMYMGDKVFLNEGTYAESTVFRIYNNTAPTAPTGLKVSVTSGQTVKPLDKVNIEFVLGTDIDVGDVLTGNIDYWNGEDWVQIAQGLKPVSGKVTFNHLIPAKSVTLAKYRVATFDGKEYGPNVESISFNVSAPDPNRQLPNALYFDGIDDYATIMNTKIPDTGDFTLEGFFKTSYMGSTPQIILTVYSNTKDFKMALCVGGGGKIAAIIGDVDMSSDGSKNYSDGVLHHFAITRKGTEFKLIIDGILVNSCVYDIAFTTNNLIELGKFLASDMVEVYYEGVIGLPRIWSDVRTITELNAGKNLVYPDNEQGLIDYYIYDPLTGNLIGKKNPTSIGSFYNGVEWAYRFSPMLGIKLPYASSAQMKENLDYLRVQVNEFRKANGLPLISWTDTTLVRSLTPIKAVHINELENGVEETYKLTGQVILNQSVKRIIEETVLPKDNRFLVNNMISRFDAIVKALMNSE